MSKRPVLGEPTEVDAPLDEEMLMDHEYDGIQEYDNPLPGWWTWIFVGTCLFSIVYFLHHHVTGTGESLLSAYQRDVAQAEAIVPAAGPLNEAEFERLAAAPATVAAGKAVFLARCAVCHGEKGEGKIGPNLTDSRWILGSDSLVSIWRTVSNGVPAKGMPPWSKQLTRQELTQVVAYVGSLRGTNVAGKPAQGKEVSPR
jgi:cytochrome c oxidase cbb3-type subunit 3